MHQTDTLTTGMSSLILLYHFNYSQRKPIQEAPQFQKII